MHVQAANDPRDTQPPSGRSAGTAAPASAAPEDIVRQLDRSAAAIFALLWAHPGVPVSKDALLEAGWPGRIIHENSLAKAISRIRAALDGREGHALTAVYGQGYKLDRPEPVRDDPALAAPLAAAPARPQAVWWRRAAPALALAGMAGALGVAAFLLRPAAPPSPPLQDSEEAAALMAFISEDLILPTDPYAEVPANPELRGVVERTAETMDERFADQPRALMALDILLAKAFSGWGEYERGALHLASARKRALAAYADARPRLVEIDALACQQMRLAGQTREAEKTCAQAAALGETLQSPHRFMALVNLGKIQFEVGDYGAAVGSLDRVLARGQDAAPGIRADALWFRALALRKLARFDAAERDFTAHLAERIALNGVDHPLTGWAHSDYGDFLAYVGEHERARAELARAQAIFDRRLGADHVEAQSPAYSIALIHLDRGEADRAAPMLERIVANFSRSLGRDHFWTAYAMTELALARAMLGEREAARALLRSARGNAAGELFGRPAKAAWFHLRWARALAEAGDEAAARDELARARKDIAKGLGADHPWLARADCIAARIERAAGNAAAAQAALSSCARRVEEAGLPATYPLRSDLAKLRESVAT